MNINQLLVVGFGAYEENGVLVAGWRLVDAPVSEVIIQDDPTRSLDSAGLKGPHLEVDGRGCYGAVDGLVYDASRALARLSLNHPATSVVFLDLPIPHSTKAEEREVVGRLATSVSSFLRAQQS